MRSPGLVLLLLSPFVFASLLACAGGREENVTDPSAQSGAGGAASWGDAGWPTEIEADPDVMAIPFAPSAGGDATGGSALAEAGGPPGDDDASARDLDVTTGPALPFDAGDGGICVGSPGPGSLRIVEIMIESTSGAGDHGEWLEVESAMDCALDLRGLRGECATGAKVNTFAVLDDVWIPARGTFLVADSSEPAIDHDLPGTVLLWAKEPGDVLRNQGATVTLLTGATIVDSVTYPADKKVPIGTSLAFPSDCSPDVRSDWTRWQPSTSSWFPGFFGTPNAPNGDVSCPFLGDE